MKNKQEQVERMFNLQFHSEPGSIDPGTPPASDQVFTDEPAQTTAGTDQVQNVEPSGNELQPANVSNQIPPEIANSKWYKDAIKGMNEAQRTAAQFKPFLEQNLTADQLQRAVQIMQNLDTDPRAFYQQLGQYLTPQQAQAIQQQAQEPDNPYKDEDWFKAAVAEAKKQMEAEIGPVKQFYTQQQREALHNQAKAKFGEVANYAPGLNIDNPADPFWKTMADLGLPPTHADWGASIAKYGSVQSFVEALKPRIIAQYQEEVRKKSNVSSTLTSAGAQQAVQSKSLNEMDIDELFNGMAEIQAAKAARLGQQF
jgi:hypothetical protein